LSLYSSPVFFILLLHQWRAGLDPFWQYLLYLPRDQQDIFSLHYYSFSVSLESGILLILHRALQIKPKLFLSHCSDGRLHHNPTTQ